MQRLFSTFPRGLPGLALLFLRLSAATALLFNCYFNRTEISGWIQLGAIAIALAICIGLLTPIVAASALLFHGLIWFQLGNAGVAVIVIVSLDAIALALLGPGAWSIDALRFGRRVVVLQPP